jgi:hypothetical protein
MHGWNWKTSCDLHCECQLQPSLTQSHPVSPPRLSLGCLQILASGALPPRSPGRDMKSSLCFCIRQFLSAHKWAIGQFVANTSNLNEIRLRTMFKEMRSVCFSLSKFSRTQGPSKRVLLASSITDRTTHLHWTQELEVKFLARMYMAPTHQSGCMTDVPTQGFI